MKRLSILFLAVLFFAVTPTASFAQPQPCQDPFAPIDCSCPENQGNPVCPIDGGLGFLLAAGIGLGAKKAYQARKVKASDVKL